MAHHRRCLERGGRLLLPRQALKAMGVGAGDRVWVTYNPDFKELVIRPMRAAGRRSKPGRRIG